MDSLSSVFLKRRKQFIQRIGKYAQLIANDHLAFVMFMIITFSALYYRQALDALENLAVETLKPWLLLGIIIWFLLLSMIGRPLWFTEPADRSYLFPLGHQFDKFWFQGSLLGVIFPAIILGTGVYIAFPLIELVTAWTVDYRFFLIIFHIVTYTIEKMLEFLRIYYALPSWIFPFQYSIISYLFLYLFDVRMAMVMILIWFLMAFIFIAFKLKSLARYRINFDYVINSEQQREANFYRFLSFFAEVPYIQENIKRRLWLDKGIRFMGLQSENRFFNLYLRIFFRNQNFSGNIRRLILLISVLLIIISNYWVSLILIMIGTYLILLQVIPVAFKYQYNLFELRFSYLKDDQIIGIQQLMLLINSLQMLIYTVAIYVSVYPLRFKIFVWCASVLWMFLLRVVYLPWYIQKTLKRRK